MGGKSLQVVALGLLAVLGNMVSGSIYPEGHFDRVHKVNDYDSLRSILDQEMGQDKTVFVRFIASEG